MKNIVFCIITLILLSISTFSYGAATAVINGPSTLTESTNPVTYTSDGSVGDLYQWFLDGNLVSTDSSFETVFDNEGQHVLTLQAVKYTPTITTATANLPITVSNYVPEINTLFTGLTYVSPNVYDMLISFYDSGNDTHQYKVLVDNVEVTPWTDLPYQEEWLYNYFVVHTFTSTGEKNITVYVRDDTGDEDSYTLPTITVENFQPEVASLVEYGSTFEKLEYTFDATFSDPNPYETFDVTIDWGDGTTTTATDLTSCDYSKDHTYTAAGTYYGQITITDTAGLDSDPADFTVKVGELELVLDEFRVITFYFNDVAKYYAEEDEVFNLKLPFLCSRLSDIFTVSIDWGDGSSTTYDMSITSSPMTPLNSGEIDVDHVFSDPGRYVVMVTLNNGLNSLQKRVRVFVKQAPFTLIDYESVIFSWDPVPGKEYNVYFSDDEGETFYMMGTSTTGYMIDRGDADGYDDILGNDDDRPAPSAAHIRLYKVE